MAALAGITLTFPGSRLDPMWRLNPTAYAEMRPLGAIVGIPMLLLSGVMLLSAVGWFSRRRWGWILAVMVIGTQVAGDCWNLITGRGVEGLIGVTIAGALLWWLLRRSIRINFS